MRRLQPHKIRGWAEATKKAVSSRPQREWQKRWNTDLHQNKIANTKFWFYFKLSCKSIEDFNLMQIKISMINFSPGNLVLRTLRFDEVVEKQRLSYLVTEEEIDTITLKTIWTYRLLVYKSMLGIYLWEKYWKYMWHV